MKRPKKTRWERSADRANARLAKAVPLLWHAGLVPAVTPAEREARFGNAREDAEQQYQERKTVEAQRGAELKAEVRLLVTPAEFAALEASDHNWPSDAMHYGYVLQRLREPRQLEVPRTRPRSTQGEMFGELPSGEIISTVEHGRAIPRDELLSRHGIEEAVKKLCRQPCQDCGWFPSDPHDIVLKPHPAGCPSLRAINLGLSEQCTPCRENVQRWPCAPHRQRTLLCASEGCVPGGERYGQQLCSRCGISLYATPYLKSA